MKINSCNYLLGLDVMNLAFLDGFAKKQVICEA